MLTKQELLKALTPLYQNESVARIALGVSIEEYRAIEAAVLSKLAAGVSVEPVAEVQTLYYGSEHPPVAFTGVVLSDKTDYYSLPFRENAQLYTASAIAAARVQALEEAAKVCDRQAIPNAGFLAEKVRALINTNLTTGEMK